MPTTWICLNLFTFETIPPAPCLGPTPRHVQTFSLGPYRDTPPPKTDWKAGGWHLTEIYSIEDKIQKRIKTRKHSSRMHTDRAVRPGSERVAMRPIVDRQTSVKTLPSPCGR